MGAQGLNCLRALTQTANWCAEDGHVLLSPPSPLQRLYAHMMLLDVDFVGGDFNMAVKGPLADVFSDSELMARRGQHRLHGVPMHAPASVPVARQQAWGPHFPR